MTDPQATTDQAIEPLEPDDEIVVAFDEFAQLLEKAPEIVRVVDEVLEHHLQDTVGPNTRQRVGYAMGQVLGLDPASFVSFYLSSSDPDGLMKAIMPAATSADGHLAAALTHLRRWQALWGYELEAVARLAEEGPDDWKSIEREILYDLSSEAWTVGHTFRMNDGRELSIKGPLTSALVLATRILQTLAMVPPDALFETEAADVAPDLLKEMAAVAQLYGVTLVEVEQGGDQAES